MNNQLETAIENLVIGDQFMLKGKILQLYQTDSLDRWIGVNPETRLELLSKIHMQTCLKKGTRVQIINSLLHL